jgi:hypothetical protein
LPFWRRRFGSSTLGEQAFLRREIQLRSSKETLRSSKETLRSRALLVDAAARRLASSRQPVGADAAQSSSRDRLRA